jgi:hypothetical protein
MAAVINNVMAIHILALAFPVMYPIQSKVGTKNSGTTSCGLCIIFVKNIAIRSGRTNATNRILVSSFILIPS